MQTDSETCFHPSAGHCCRAILGFYKNCEDTTQTLSLTVKHLKLGCLRCLEREREREREKGLKRVSGCLGVHPAGSSSSTLPWNFSGEVCEALRSAVVRT
jgi:hypothetical protein